MDGLQMKYFVLNPNKIGPYGEASRKAIREYAESIKETNPSLSADLIKWIVGIKGELNAKSKSDTYGG